MPDPKDLSAINEEKGGIGILTVYNPQQIEYAGISDNDVKLSLNDAIFIMKQAMLPKEQIDSEILQKWIIGRTLHAECAWNKLADALASVVFEFCVRESDKSEDILNVCSNFIKLSPNKPDVVLNMNDDKSQLALLFHSALLCLSVLSPETPKKQSKMEDSNECNDSGMKLTTSPGESTDSASTTQTRKKRRYGILHNYNVRETANRNVNQPALEETVTQANMLTIDAHITTKWKYEGEAVVVQSAPFVQSNESENLNDLSPNPQTTMELRSNPNEESEDDQMVDDSNKNFGSSEGSSSSSSHSSGSSAARQSSYTQFVILVRDKIDNLLLLVLLTAHECF